MEFEIDVTKGRSTQRRGGAAGGNCPPKENYIYLQFLETINYSLDIWDFFQHISLTAPW